ncbi:MAG: hypothetical protein HXL54_03855 [Solobacterium sp.]|nr:hypothetical protein [Solobacterium sp.]
MTNKQLYFVNRSVLFLAIAYAINGYTLPALACSIVSAFLTCEFIGYEKVKDSLIQVLVVGIVLIGMIRMVGLQASLPMLEVSAYVSALFAVNWVKHHFHTVSELLGYILSLMFVFIGVAVVLPLSSLQFGYTMVFITIVFMPILCSYGIAIFFTKEYANTLDKKASLR